MHVFSFQFPERIDQLAPVTQLYISIDAATKESLKAVDRPIFDDFWERYARCLHAQCCRLHVCVELIHMMHVPKMVQGW